jgi:hypothetical protein
MGALLERMCYTMVNPVITFLFDLFLIGAATGIIAGMVAEYLASRRPSVGATPGFSVVRLNVPRDSSARPRRQVETTLRSRRPAQRLGQMRVGG